MGVKKKRFVFLLFVILFFLTIQYINSVSISTDSRVNIVSGTPAPVLGEINNSIFVCEASALDYEFNATDSDASNMTLDISPKDPFFVQPLFFTGESSITAHIYSNVLTKADVGGINSGNKTYEETINLSDATGSDIALTNITILEINNPVIIEEVGVQTIWTKGENSTFFKQIGYDDVEFNLGFGEINFNISFPDSQDLFNISLDGLINFTANNETALGNYNVTVCVNDTGVNNPHENISLVCGQDGSSIITCNNFTLTVTDENRAPYFLNYFPINFSFDVSSTDILDFNITKNDPDGTIPDTYWYVDDVFQEYDAASSTDNFTYVFGCGISGDHIVKVEITDGLLNDSLQWNVSVQSVACEKGVSTGGGGSGAGGVRASFKVEPDLIEVIVLQGESVIEILNITNIGDVSLDLVVDFEGLSKFVEVSEEFFSLSVEESKRFLVKISADKDEVPDSYIGIINFKDEERGISKAVNVIIKVQEKRPLFDLISEVLTKEIEPGDKLKANIELINFGNLKNIDVLLYYSIRDFEGKVLTFKEESLLVEEEFNITRKLKVPEDALPGDYVFYSKVTYESVGATSADSFKVVEKKAGRFSFVILVAILIILIIIILFYLRRRSKEKK